MDTQQFEDRYTDPVYSLSRVVFYPDRIYHATLAAGARCARYRYNVQELRTKLDMAVLRGEVYLDGQFFSRFLRVEYRAARLAEAVREQHRTLGDRVRAWLRVEGEGGEQAAEAHATLHHDPALPGYYVEIWDTLEAPATSAHDFSVIALMGWQRPITRVRALAPALRADVALRRVELAFSEPDRTHPEGTPVPDAVWDNNLLSSHQVRRTAAPSAAQNTVSDLNYLLDFQRGFFIQSSDVAPVLYRNPMMDGDNPEQRDDNIVEMRWLLQRALGGSVVFFHEVTIPPGAIEGTHQHVGSEELYYFVEGEGTAYMGEGDDPATGSYPTVERAVYNLGVQPCKELPVRPGSLIFTKSGGMHGVRNGGTAPLKFVAFLYHTQ